MIHNTNLFVTIAIPTYNRANSYLKQAIESAVNQTYQNIEIIISDNYSSDNTETVVRSFNDTRIRYFKHGENIGANNNFNFCLEQAKGEYFLLLMDDDLIDSDFIETCMKGVNYDGNVGIIRTGTRIIDSKGTIIREHPNTVGGLSLDEFFRAWFANKTTLYICSTIFNTVGLKEIGGFQSKKNLFQDVFAMVQLVSKFGRVDVQDIKASFRKHAGEMTFKAKVGDWCEDSLVLLDLICELFPEKSSKVIRKEGMRFFSTLNYLKARKIKSPYKRFITYLIVFKMFNYHYLPPQKFFILPVYDALYGTPIYHGIKLLKKIKTL